MLDFDALKAELKELEATWRRSNSKACDLRNDLMEIMLQQKAIEGRAEAIKAILQEHGKL